MAPPPAPVPKPPVHVAVIMDGNGRWAKSRGLPRTAGHKRGLESVRATVRACLDVGVRYLTLFGFSSENWRRPMPEVTDLMGLLRFYLRSEVDDLHRNGVRIRFIGERDRLGEEIVRLIVDAEALTLANTRLTLVVALSYGARQEIVRAARLAAQAVADGKLVPDAIEEDTLAARLFTADIPDPDLLIRTSGEQRLSNFLLWQLAYAELVFVDTLWPDFGEDDLRRAVSEFNRRERRYGAVSGQ